jgi:hypothetical protein
VTNPKPETSPQASLLAGFRRSQLYDSHKFRWHACGFLAINVALNLANVVTGRPWWAFWPLVATSLALGLHYLVYKTAAVDERWVDERVEELNLKSYDRSHIENLKARYSGKNRPPPTDRAQ